MTATLPAPLRTTTRAVSRISGPTAEVVRVTPDLAREWLDRNTKNRNIRKATVARYARDMASGDWHMTGEPIKFSASGVLLDGQHRLTAVATAGVPVDLLVVRNLNDVAQAVMDTGDKRTASDALSLLGESHTALLAAAARLGISIERGRMDGRMEVTHSEVVDYVADNPDLRDAVAFVQPLARRTDCLPAVMAHTTLILGRIDRQAVAQFWLDAAEKVGLAYGDPVIALTNRFAEARRNRERLSHAAYLSAIYRAWNARRAGSQLRVIKINSSAGGLVPVPEPR